MRYLQRTLKPISHKETVRERWERSGGGGRSASLQTGQYGDHCVAINTDPVPTVCLSYSTTNQPTLADVMVHLNAHIAVPWALFLRCTFRAPWPDWSGPWVL